MDSESWFEPYLCLFLLSLTLREYFSLDHLNQIIHISLWLHDLGKALIRLSAYIDRVEQPLEAQTLT